MVNLFTISKMKQPCGIIDEYNKIGNFEFIYENDANYYEFITQNPIENYSIETNGGTFTTDNRYVYLNFLILS